ncbi:hypothetical protein [Hymenobacter psychrotolerans]|uniref:Uncharacterized protein n=1 Tax=Hymenobacter psychrotolerans DSM 18569 TaxID=1121959 RepID=A0A1M7BFT2_9BACT|nr:hypothetical protein [Hymenobacter psychrotolerans]SHL53807.1 hypothetical protein SAMN02746009_02899 [Hymenobacter psychrotolerans DSM 18569]
MAGSTILLFAKLYSAFAGTLLIGYLLGRVLLRLANVFLPERNVRIFLSLLSGLTVLIVAYASMATRGVTILLPVAVIIIAVLFLWNNKKSLNDELVDNSHWSTDLITILGTGTLIFSARYFLLYDSSSEFLVTPFQDYVYYGRLTQPLNIAGIETNVLEAIYPQFITEQPYHYFDVWLNALLVKCTGVPSVWALYLTTYSVLIVVVATGFMALLAYSAGVKQKWIPVLSLLLLTVTGISWPVVSEIDFIRNGALIASSTLPVLPKLAPVYIFLILAVLALLQGRYTIVGLTLATLPLVYVSTAPTIGLGVASLALFLWLRHRVTLAGALKMVAPTLFASLYIAGFYVLQPEPYQFPATGRAFALSTIIPSWSEYRTLINIGFGTLLNFGFYFAPYALLLFLLLRSRIKKIAYTQQEVLVWFGASVFMATALRAFGSHYIDSFQFFANTIIPFAAIVIAVLIGIALTAKTQRHYVLTALVLLVLAVINNYTLFFERTKTLSATRYSTSFLRVVQSELQNLGPRGAFIMSPDDYENVYMMSPDSYVCGTYVSNFKNDYAFTTLSALDLEHKRAEPHFQRDSIQAEQATRKSSFYRFQRFKQMQGQKLALDSAKYQFVVENGISFICTSKRATLPLVLQPLVDRSYRDSYSGEMFYVLRPSSKTLSNAYY